MGGFTSVSSSLEQTISSTLALKIAYKKTALRK
jgi:hypothetical protein